MMAITSEKLQTNIFQPSCKVITSTSSSQLTTLWQNGVFALQLAMLLYYHYQVNDRSDQMSGMRICGEGHGCRVVVHLGCLSGKVQVAWCLAAHHVWEDHRVWARWGRRDHMDLLLRAWWWEDQVLEAEAEVCRRYMKPIFNKSFYIRCCWVTYQVTERSLGC